MPNRRKDMILYGLWLTPEEVEGMEQVISDETYLRQLGKLLQAARKRGDFKKK